MTDELAPAETAAPIPEEGAPSRVKAKVLESLREAGFVGSGSL
jgi:hypothetical protein